MTEERTPERLARLAEWKEAQASKAPSGVPAMVAIEKAIALLDHAPVVRAVTIGVGDSVTGAPWNVTVAHSYDAVGEVRFGWSALMCHDDGEWRRSIGSFKTAADAWRAALRAANNGFATDNSTCSDLPF